MEKNIDDDFLEKEFFGGSSDEELEELEFSPKDVNELSENGENSLAKNSAPKTPEENIEQSSENLIASTDAIEDKDDKDDGGDKNIIVDKVDKENMEVKDVKHLNDDKRLNDEKNNKGVKGDDIKDVKKCNDITEDKCVNKDKDNNEVKECMNVKLDKNVKGDKFDNENKAIDEKIIEQTKIDNSSQEIVKVEELSVANSDNIIIDSNKENSSKADSNIDFSSSNPENTLAENTGIITKGIVTDADGKENIESIETNSAIKKSDSDIDLLEGVVPVHIKKTNSHAIKLDKVEKREHEHRPLDRYSKTSILLNPPKKRIKPDPSYKICKKYDIVPYVSALLNFETYSITATRNMRWLFTGGEDGHIYKWDFFSSMNGKTMLTQWQRHQQVESVTKAGVMSSYFFHKETEETPMNLSPVYSMDVHSEGLWLVSGKKYWDLNTGGISRSFEGHISQLSCGSFQPINSDFASGLNSRIPLFMTTSVDGSTLLWDIRDKSALPMKITPPPKTPPWALSSCWSADGKRIHVGRRNSTIDEFDIVAGKLLRSLRLPSSSGPVSQVCPLPNNNSILSASFDNLRVWDLSTNVEKRGFVQFQIIPAHHGATISQMYIDESGKYLATAVGSREWDGTGTNTILFYEISTV
ncbi:Transcription factor spt8 [Smittium culicis]|uniref:Transcription factor spt8 n=2 Tax=Smittium culicis TaxID=133412 RepID=A0A1R1YF16_9FUNG|nr:Transcription factor spt8 [Smittium culicis]